MKRFALLASLLVLSASTWACPAGEVLVKQYGISAFGIERPIPAAKAPTTNFDDFIEVALPDHSDVRDGVYHTAFVNPATHKLWIHQTGGFALSDTWYGPADAKDLPLAGCLTRRQARQQNPLPSLQVPSL